MMTIAYLSNQFPSTVEPYVMDEIAELRARGVRVIPCSAKRALTESLDSIGMHFAAEAVNLDCFQARKCFEAAIACIFRLPLLIPFLTRLLTRGPETIGQRVRALAHTFLGVYLALLLKDRAVQHVHVHHGYFSAWIGMVAARLLHASFSMTLHGSDLLVHAAFLDTKLQHCRFCLTISDYNRDYILNHYRFVDSEKIIVHRLGVDIPPIALERSDRKDKFQLLSVGRLHVVKDHQFLLRACQALKDRGLPISCWIAGDGPERFRLQQLIRELDLENEVTLLGHVARQNLAPLYRAADLVVLTSRSEGVPVVLMEAMAHNCLVLAPAITGIPELVKHGENGFLYCPQSLQNFVAIVSDVLRSFPVLDLVRQNARDFVSAHFSRNRNLAAFADLFLAQLAFLEKPPHAHSLLQQVQLRFQRNRSLPIRTDGPDAVAGP